MAREQVTVEKVVCDACGSTIADSNKSGSGVAHEVRVMDLKLNLRVVARRRTGRKVPGLGGPEPEVVEADLCESCLTCALKDAGLA